MFAECTHYHRHTCSHSAADPVEGMPAVADTAMPSACDMTALAWDSVTMVIAFGRYTRNCCSCRDKDS